jgi:hypothetical protein
LACSTANSDFRNRLAFSGRNRIIKALSPVSVIFLLTGCQIGSDVDIQTIDGITVFTVSINGNAPICVSDIRVDETIGGKRNRKWILMQNDADAAAGKSDCDNIFIFGKGHTGYQQQYDGKPLEAGKTYYVSFSGPGFGKGKSFVITK